MPLDDTTIQEKEERLHFPSASLWRRLAAMLYDSILVMALVMVISAVYHGIVNIWLLGLEDAPTGFNPVLSTLLTLIVFFFFAHCWGKNGQTLGMQAWRLRIQSTHSSQPLSLMQSLLRFMVAIPSIGLCGAGMLWMLVDRDGKTWQDRYSETEMVLLPKEK